MKPTNRFYAGQPPDPGGPSPLHRCHNCQRLNTLQDYRPDGDCPQCQAPYTSEEE